MNPDHKPELGHSDLLYGSQLPAEKSGHEWAYSSQLRLTIHGMFVLLRSLKADTHMQI